MALTYFDEQKEYITNHFRVKNWNSGYLLTTEHGSWIFLSSEEYSSFIAGKAHGNVNLFSLLKEKGFVVTDSNISQILDSYRQRYNFLFSGASVHTVFVRDKSMTMNTEIAENTVNFILQSSANEITIEFRDDLLSGFKIIEYIVNSTKNLNSHINKQINFRLVSSLKGMSNEILNFLVKEHFRIITFFDGPAELHDKNGVYIDGNSYEHVREWVDKIRRVYGINLIPNITKFSLKYPKEIIDEYLQYNQSYISLMPLSISTFYEKWPEVGYKAEEFIGFWKEVMNYLLELNNKRLFREELAVIMLRSILRKQGAHHKDFTSPHGSIITNLAYMPDGKVYPCDEAINFELFKLGNVSDKYSDVVLSPQALALIRASLNDYLMIDANVYKPYLGVCSVCSYAENQNIIPKLPNFWYKIQVSVLDYLFEKLLFDENDRKILLNWTRETRTER